MPIAKLEFKLPEENDEHYTACHAAAYRYALVELDNDLRKVTKYGSSLLHNKEAERLEIAVATKVREMIRENLGGIELH